MSDQPQPKPSGPGAKELTGKIGKYEIVKPLGKGAMGVVYLAMDTVLDREIALKVMVSGIADDPELLKRFEREAKAVARMQHPNVVNVFDLGYHTDGSPYMAMELLRGEDLAKAMRQVPPLSVEKKVNILVQVLAGLAHAHQAGIIHRDIKPANIFLNHDGTVKIMDFGVARLTTASMTGTGSIVGTADYMSPEQVKGAKVDGRSDLFSVGCMFYELLAGRRPFRAENLMAVFYKITHEEPDFNLIPEGADYDALMPVLKKSLAKNLETRYTTAYAFAGDLRDFLKGHAATAAAHGDNVLEGLVDIAPPPSAGPQALTDLFGGEATVVEASETDVGATVNLGTGRGRTIAPAPTVRGATAPTVVGQAGQGTVRGTVKAAPRPAQAAAPVARPAPQPARVAPSGPGAVYAALGVGVLALAGVGYVLWQNSQPKPTPAPPVTAPPVTQAAVPSTTLPPPPPTVAPTPPPVDTTNKTLRAAQTAFQKSDYARAVSQAQAALKEDPRNADAQRLLENALAGQKARAHFDAADQALRANDLAKAQSEADAGRQLAAWDSRGTDILGRIRDAHQRAESQAASQKAQLLQAQLNGLLGTAEQALGASKYDAAIAAYDEVLKLDPTNQRATLGRTSAVSARAVANAAANAGAGTAAPAKPAGRAFAVGKTEAKSGDRTGGAVPAGFEETPGVTAKAATQQVDLPGKLSFEIEPKTPRPGDKYTVRIVMQNEGTAPISIRDMIMTLVVNGRKTQAPVPPNTKDVAPSQKATLLSTSDVWKEDTTSWSMEAMVRTTRGESYKNTVEWK
jgi:serine/threonine-protein kinase